MARERQRDLWWHSCGCCGGWRSNTTRTQLFEEGGDGLVINYLSLILSQQQGTRPLPAFTLERK